MQAVREQFAILTLTLVGKGYYTIVVINYSVHSTGTLWGLAHKTKEDCEASMLALFGEHRDGIEQGLSNRNKKILHIAGVKDV